MRNLLTYRASLSGFHNPYLMKGWTAEKFLTAWITRQKQLLKKKRGWQRKILIDWVEKHWDTQLIYVEKCFPNTLRRGTNPDATKKRSEGSEAYPSAGKKDLAPEEIDIWSART